MPLEESTLPSEMSLTGQDVEAAVAPPTSPAWWLWLQVRRRLIVLAWVGTLGAAALLLFAYAYPQDFRREGNVYLLGAWFAFMVRTFQFHIGLGVLVCAVIAAALRRWRLLPLAVVLALFCTVADVWSYVPKTPAPAAGESLRVMSVNLLGINREHEVVVAEVLAADADVVLLQEYMPAWHVAFSKALADKYPYHLCYVRDDFFGQALYSRRPFVEPPEELALGRRETPLVRAVIRLNGRDVAVYNVHLVPPSRRGRLEQRLEFADLCERLRGEKLPAIVGGDFNFTNNSPFGDEVGALDLTDACDISGYGRGTTWPDDRWWWYNKFPGVRLDHVYLSPALTSTQCRIGRGKGSDHRPVMADVGFAMEER